MVKKKNSRDSLLQLNEKETIVSKFSSLTTAEQSFWFITNRYHSSYEGITAAKSIPRRTYNQNVTSN